MDESAVQVLRTGYDAHYEPTQAGDPARLRSLVADAAALIVRNQTRVDAVLLAAAPALRVVGRLGVGLDNIAFDLCAARDIRVIPATGANARAVTEYVIGAILVLVRGIFVSTPQVARGKWPRAALSAGGEVAGQTLGLVGFGQTGRLTAGLARGLGLHVAAFDPAGLGDADDGVTALDLDRLVAAAASRQAKEYVHWASEPRREETAPSDLWGAVKCGESGTASGLAACFGETSELTGAERTCATRAATPAAAAEFLRTRLAYSDFINANKTNDLSESQPAKGNIAGDLTPVEEKAFGNFQKIGKTANSIDVSGLPRRELTLDLTVRTANGRVTATEALGHREFVPTKLYRGA